MRTRRTIAGGVLAAALVATVSAAAPTGAEAASPQARSASPAVARCATAWGTGAKSTGTHMSTAELYLVRAGRHACFDRIVFDVNGPARVDASARYVRTVLSDPKGDPVHVSGHAAMQVVVRAPWLGTGSSGHQPSRRVPTVGDRLVSTRTLHGLVAVRDVRFAGTFEGISTVGVGVDARRPFRVFVTRDGAVRHVVVDVAHR